MKAVWRYTNFGKVNLLYLRGFIRQISFAFNDKAASGRLKSMTRIEQPMSITIRQIEFER